MVKLLTDCCEGFDGLNFGKMDLDLFWWTCHKPRINWSDPNLYYCMAVIIFNPVFWNCASRYEYRTKFLTRLFGSKKLACFLFCCIIAILALCRFKIFYQAVTSQESWSVLDRMIIKMLGQALTVSGIIMATWAIVALNFYGYGFADSFDILMDERVTSFPFNIFDNPMYLGSTLEFIGASLVKASPAGLLLSALIGIMYLIALHFEEPFTAMIYAEKAMQNVRKWK